MDDRNMFGKVAFRDRPIRCGGAPTAERLPVEFLLKSRRHALDGDSCGIGRFLDNRYQLYFQNLIVFHT
ncbi:MAG: hypothetical protein ACLGJC_28370 [Alphaproteobacteria bacterium]